MNKTKEAAIARSERLIATQRLINNPSESVEKEEVRPKVVRRAKRRYMVHLDIEANLANA